MIDGISAKLLRGLYGDLSQPILAELSSDVARERARVGASMLARLAEKGEVPAAFAAEMASRYRDSLQDCSQLLTHEPAGPDEAAELDGFRRAGARLISSFGPEGQGLPTLDALRDLARADAELCLAMGSAASASPKVPEQSSKAPNVTTETLTRYLRDKFPQASSLEVVQLVMQPGGRSKATYFVSLSRNEIFPEQLVMRQDTGVDHIATRVVDENAVLASLAVLDLPLPTPLYCEPEETVLGGPFLFMKRLSGTTKGSYFGFDEQVGRGVAEDLAVVMARLHGFDVKTLPFDDLEDGDNTRKFGGMVAERRSQWRSAGTYVSPIIEYAFLWLEDECRKGLGAPALIHGDIRGHNLLVEDDRVSGVLDWEFAHIGDPAEDLAYSRPAIEQLMPWEEFLALYRQAGGTEIDERRLRIFTVWGLVRNAAFAAGSIRNYVAGAAPDFRQGAVSYAAISIFERQIAEALLPVL